MADTTALTDRAPSRGELLARWQAARHRRDAAPENSPAYRQAVIEIGDIELQINAIDVERSEGRPVKPIATVEDHHS